MEQIPKQEQKEEVRKDGVLRPVRPLMSRLPGMLAVTVATTLGTGVATEAEAGNTRNVLGAIAGVMAVGAIMQQGAQGGNRLEIKRPEDFKVEVDGRAQQTMQNLRLNYDASSQKIISPNGSRLTLDEAGRKNISVRITGLTNSQLQLDYEYTDPFGKFKQTAYVTVDAFQNFKISKEMSKRVSQ
jgi:hypothetical protein